MFRKIILSIILIFMLVLPVSALTGTYTTHDLFYRPGYGSSGFGEFNEFNDYLEIADQQIYTNKTAIADIDLSLYYLKTEIDTIGEVETIWGIDIISSTELSTYCETTQDYLKTSENADLTEENVEDYVGGMVIENTETRISVTYQDSDGTLDFVVDNNLDDYDNTISQFIGDYTSDLTSLWFEGATADSFELNILIDDPTADRTIHIPNASGILVLDATACTDIEGLGLVIDTGVLKVDVSDVSDEIAADIAEGELADSIILSADIKDGVIAETDLKVVDSPADEDIFTYEITNGDFEWHSKDEVGIKFSKFDATVAPGVNNDIDEGYVVGSRWYDVNNENAYTCLDNSDGAAVWSKFAPIAWGDITGTLTNQTDLNTVLGNKLENITAESILDLSDTPIAFDDGKFLKSGAEAVTFESITESDITDLGSYLENVVEDTTPQLGGDLDHNNKRDTEVCSVEFNGLYDNGNSGASVTIDWQKGNYQKVTISENTLISFSNPFVGTLTLNINYGGNYTVGFNAGYTILEEGGEEIVFTKTNGAFDILKVYYFGTSGNYVVGLLADVKD